MPSFFRIIALNALLAGSILSHAAQAYPTENIKVNAEIVGPNQPAHNNPSHISPVTNPDLRIRVVDSFDDEEDGFGLTRRATQGDKPKNNHKCPATKKYHEEKSYTSNQLYTAMMKGADLVKSEKHIGERMLLKSTSRYPFTVTVRKLTHVLQVNTPMTSTTAKESTSTAEAS